MKKFFLVIVVMAFFTSQIDAQLRFGAKAGLNFDNAKVKNSIAEPKSAAGWQTGLMVQAMVPFVGIAIQPELLYTVKNIEIAGVTNSLNYVEIPINLQWGPDLLLMRPFVMGGPYFAYAVSTDKWKEAEKLDWGIGLGAGLDFLKFHATIRYAWGMANVSPSTLYELKNRTLTLSLGYFF